MSNDENSDGGDDDRSKSISTSTEDNSLKKGPWTVEEDEILAAYVTAHGLGNWNAVRTNTGLARCGKSCRLRWTNHLRPDLRKGAFNAEEQRKIIELHALMGNKWAKMAQELPGRTDNEIKNFWNTRQKKRKRAGLPLYPDDIKPGLSTDNPQSSLNASTSSNVPEMIFNTYKPTSEEHPLHVQPISCIPENSTFEQHSQTMHPPASLDRTCESNATPAPIAYDQFQGDYISGSNASCSSGPPSVSELPPFPSIDDTQDPPAEYQHYESRSPRSNGYLESILYPPKILDGPDHSSMQGEYSNSENKYILDKIGFASQDDQYALKDTLISIIFPHVHIDLLSNDSNSKFVDKKNIINERNLTKNASTI